MCMAYQHQCHFEAVRYDTSCRQATRQHQNTLVVQNGLGQLHYNTKCNIIEWLRENTEHLDIFVFFHPSLNGVLFPMFCLLVEGECQILVF